MFANIAIKINCIVKQGTSFELDSKFTAQNIVTTNIQDTGDAYFLKSYIYFVTPIKIGMFIT